jgi:hypothetical protein
MKKPWSVTTTMRNPERLVGFLKVLAKIDGRVWDSLTQEHYQILLIQYREYGYGNPQFYRGLPQNIVDLINDTKNEIPYNIAKAAFKLKNYEDPPMRGRQSMNPLKKLGFATIKDNRIKVTELGKKLVTGDIDLGDAFLRCFLKWQIPNPGSNDYSHDSYNINPYIATLHLITAVNMKEEARGNKAKGLSKREFALFGPSLINYRDIDAYADKILDFRDVQIGLGRADRKIARDAYRRVFANEFLETSDPEKIEKLLNNLKDYGDNALRYFRLTRYFYIRGGGFFIDTEPRRAIEINSILANYTGSAISFSNMDTYIEFISDYTQPHLPWETREKQIEIAEGILSENNGYEDRLGITNSERPPFETLCDLEIASIISQLRAKRSNLQEQINHQESQTEEKLREYIAQLENIFDYEDRPILLERLAAHGLHALNDAINIKPNYPVGDDNEPTFTAPAGVPDIECYYLNFNAICEVTMLTGRDQWYNEGQPVMRHLRDFENKFNDKSQNIYCLFIAPSIHRDTLNTFWMANKYEYEGSIQRIIPITIKQFTIILKVMLTLRQNSSPFSHKQLQNLYDSILVALREASGSTDWLHKSASCVEKWSGKYLFGSVGFGSTECAPCDN